jgi:restriction endonuclease Mrr
VLAARRQPDGAFGDAAMRTLHCRNCGKVHELPDYHGPMLITCPQCRWQEVIPARRHISPDLDQGAGKAYEARHHAEELASKALDRVTTLTQREFEKFCRVLFERLGRSIEPADTAIDESHEFEMTIGVDPAYVKCVHRAEGHALERELIENLAGAMRHAGVERGVLVTTGDVQDEDRAAAEQAGIELIDRERLLDHIVALGEQTLEKLEP